jgi:hypothetical protein
MLDGTYFNGWCVLIAFNGQHVIDWQWCDTEKKIAWQALLERIPAPNIAIIDGGTGLRSALKDSWPSTRVQRCYFHIFRNIRRELTYQPRLPAGKELAALTSVTACSRDRCSLDACTFFFPKKFCALFFLQATNYLSLYKYLAFVYQECHFQMFSNKNLVCSY